jgi:hypothetical protein
MKTIEEKAKAYDRALEIAKAWCKLDSNDLSNGDLETLFPEIRESEDERVRQRFINLVKMSSEVGGFALHKWEADEMLAWLEKQGEMDMKSYKAAEDEKREFVGDGFIKCYADFQDFKEGETYWLEYVGNDNYNVRSDNLLGKTYHITPCQLYTIFKKMTWLEKQDEQKPQKALTWKHWENGIAGNGEGNDAFLIKWSPWHYSVSSCLGSECDYIELSELDELLRKPNFRERYNRIKDSEWFKKTHEGMSVGEDDEIKTPEESLGIDSDTYNEIVDECIYGEQEPNYTTLVETGNGGINALVTRELSTNDYEEKPADKAEPKFKVGDWIVFNGLILHIDEVVDGYYRTTSIGGIHNSYDWDIDNVARLWTIQDAKDGDVLVGSEWGVILMFRGIGNTEWDDVIDYHCYYNCCRECFIVQEDVRHWGSTKNNQLKPATKEQRDLLFAKMKEAGYELDAEKKKLIKLF